MGDKPSLWVTYPKTSAVLRLTARVRINARSCTLLIVSVLTPLFTSAIRLPTPGPNFQFPTPNSQAVERRLQPARFSASRGKFLRPRGWRERCTSASHMRKKVGALVQDADEARGERSAAPFVPNTTSLPTLSAAAQECRGCDLYRTATQVVFGAGPRTARVMFVGEQR